MQQILEKPKSAKDFALSQGASKSTKDFALSASDQYLKRAIVSLEKWQKSRGQQRRETALAKDIADILDRLKQGLE